MIVYTVALNILNIVASYIFCLLAYSFLFKSRGINHKLTTYIPVLNHSFSLGKIYDDISSNYKQKTHRAWILLIFQILSLVLNISLVLVIVNLYPQFLSADKNTLADFLNNMNGPSFNLFAILFFLTLVLGITYFVFYIKTLHEIYREYMPKKASFFSFIVVVCYLFLNFEFIGPMFVYMFRKKVPQFTLLNSKTTQFK